MRFIVKTFRVPVTKEKDKCVYQEVPLTDDILKNSEETDIDDTHKISMEAKSISKYNDAQLKQAFDYNLKHAQKKLLAKID